MNEVTRQHSWSTVLKEYSEQNKDRPTRLGLFELEKGNVNDYWIEDGLPLTGIDVDFHGDIPAIEIVLGDYTHSIKGARRFELHFSLNGDDDGISIIDSEGKTTVLRFEDHLSR
jgi:hypothetical protein